MKKITTILLLSLGLFSVTATAQSSNEKKSESANTFSKKEHLDVKKKGRKMTLEEKKE